MSDPDPMLTAARLVLAVVNLFMVVFGVRIAVLRRPPLIWLRGARRTERQRSEPVRFGGGVALVNASLLLQQAPFLIPMPHVLGRALFAVALLLVVCAAGWYYLVRR
ncbi:hypothetical protein OG559_10655 [Micromonospora sp. NBC_01405]|uniref:hypothetical protein n=1 Tax=Micromonospora sp. NBC_01405 TaxID=2903589 RepID=UPI0032506B5C